MSRFRLSLTANPPLHNGANDMTQRTALKMPDGTPVKMPDSMMDEMGRLYEFACQLDPNDGDVHVTGGHRPDGSHWRLPHRWCVNDRHEIDVSDGMPQSLSEFRDMLTEQSGDCDLCSKLTK